MYPAEGVTRCPADPEPATPCQIFRVTGQTIPGQEKAEAVPTQMPVLCHPL